MKSSSILLLLVLVGAGYVLYPMALPIMENAGLVAKAEKPSEDEEVVKELEPAPVVEVDLTGVTPEDFPDEVQLLVPVKLQIPGMEEPMVLKKGAMVEPVRLQGDSLIFKPKMVSVNAKIPIDDTNFKALIKPILEVKRRNEAEERARLAAQEKEANEAVVPEPMPEPRPEPQPEPKAAQLSEAAVIDLMKSSIAAGAIKEFTADKVLGWKLEGVEEIDGQEYQVGLIIYNADTIFGVQKHEVKALILDGKIKKWIWAQTGVEVR